MTGFVKIACVADVPEGTGRSVEANGRRIALFNVGGVVHALEGTCPHRGGPLGEGMLRGSTVTCPWHFWRFDVVTGQATDVPESCIETFDVKIEGADILVEERALAAQGNG